MVVQHVNLEHSGGRYIYRVHNKKTESLCNASLASLRDYLYHVFKERPDDYFSKGPRGSALKFKTDQNILELAGHEVSSLARHGLEFNKQRFNSNHSKVQLFMLENDKSTIAIEVPIWLTTNELHNYKTLFNSEDPLTGHIDVLRVEDGNVWVWDYKPNAHKEKYASTQVYFYSLMLSKRAGIPLELFRCGYFDDRYAYVFKPEETTLASMATATIQEFYQTIRESKP